MSLIIIRKEEPVPVQKHGKFSWDHWYQQNRSRLSQKRAKRYREDPAYREAALKRGRAQRKKKPTPAAPVPDGYTLTLKAAAALVGVSVWTLREWRRKNYFPEPLCREGRLWFTASQVEWLYELEAFFSKFGRRVTDQTSQTMMERKSQLDDVVALIYSNWT